MTGFGCPFVSRWGWCDGGWLRLMGFRDFGGSSTVHMYVGGYAFIAAIIIGARIGRFSDRNFGVPKRVSALGTFSDTFGFLGFNASSQLIITRHGDGLVITSSAFNTLLADSGGTSNALMINRFLPLWSCNWSYIITVNGPLASMCGSLLSATVHLVEQVRRLIRQR